MTVQILILVVSLIVLGVAADYLVRAAIRLAHALHVSEAFIGLTLVSLGTSAPEIAVSVKAALAGQGALSVGNVIGSNIFNLGFILGLVAVVAPQAISRKMVYRDGVVLLVSTCFITLMLWNQFVSALEGLLLLLLLVTYNLYLWMKREVPEGEVEVEEKHHVGKLKDLGVFVVSLVVLVKSADFVVESAVFIATAFGISEWAIGATVVAAGTSLPEVATSVMATIKKRFGLSIGNVVGSDIFNTLGIIGVSAVITPLTLVSGSQIFGFADNLVSMFLLVLTILLVLVFMRTGWRISRKEGVFLLIIAFSRMWFEVYLGSGG